MQWIDTHVHLFTPATQGEPPLLIDGVINSADHYLKSFGKKVPAGIVVVDFSMAKTSDHVMASLADLAEHDIPAKGVIRGNIDDERTFDWITQPQVAGIRLYGKGSIPDFTENKAQWDRLFNLLRQQGKHVCLFGDPSWIRRLADNLPGDLTLLIDHIGMGDAARGANADADFNALIDTLAARHKSAGRVFFKGPGYRTSFDKGRTVPFILKILDRFGESQLLLGASDAPFAGPVVEKGTRWEGRKNQECIGYAGILDYLNGLVEAVAAERSKSAEMLQMQLLYSNAQKLYQFAEKAKKAA